VATKTGREGIGFSATALLQPAKATAMAASIMPAKSL
jgi:hypothetical protein